jgi:hypothetical protein
MDHHKMPDRIVIHTRDIQNIFGLAVRSAQREMIKLKNYTGRIKGEFVTVAEFCEYYRLDEDDIRPFLKA